MRVDGDRITFFDHRDQPAHKRLWGDMTNDHAPGAARKPTVRDESDRLPETLADQC